MTNIPDLSIVIVNYNSGSYLYQTVRSVYGSGPSASFEIIIVDNCSTDHSLDKVISDYPEIRLIKLDENIGFAAANNRGSREANGEFLVFLNNDTVVPAGALDALLTGIRNHPDFGILAPVLLHGDGSPQLNYGPDPGLISEFFTKYFSKFKFRLLSRLRTGKMEKNVPWVSGACFIIPASLYRELGGFDEGFFLYYEDADLGKRVREKGLKNHITAAARITHFLGKSAGPVFNELLPRIKKGHLHYYKKHNSSLSLKLLKMYLLLRFRFNRLAARAAGNQKGVQILDQTIGMIKEFK